jgi:hypothetical protein
LLAPNIDVLDVRLFATVQASLLFSVILAFACSRFSKRATHVFLVLAFGVLLHLLIDACQIKWGNGPRFFAPFDWTIANFGLFWPEQLPSHLMTGIGALYVIYAFAMPIKNQAQDLILPRGKSQVAFLGAIAIYAFLPFLLLDVAEEAGVGSVKLIRMEERSGQTITLDRARFRQDGDRMTVELYSGQFIGLEGIDESLPEYGKLSLRGVFLEHEVIQANAFHVNDARYRELASILGLSIVAGYWIIILLGRFRDGRVQKPD